MPAKRGPNTYHGYLSPPHGTEIDAHQRHVLKVVYGTCREQNPGESQEAKAKCARVAWSAAKRA